MSFLNHLLTIFWIACRKSFRVGRLLLFLLLDASRCPNPLSLVFRGMSSSLLRSLLQCVTQLRKSVGISFGAPLPRKCYLVAWKTICQPKDKGGLGFRYLRMLNHTHMMKLAWMLVAEPTKLWVHIMRTKYSCGVQAVPEIKARNNASPTWRAIVNAWKDVDRNISWVINDGRNARFWRDSWILGYPSLHTIIGNGIPSGELNFPVAYYACDGQWDWPALQNLLPLDVCNRIAVIKPPSHGRADFPC